MNTEVNSLHQRLGERVWPTANAVGLSAGMPISLAAFLAGFSTPSPLFSFGLWVVAGSCVAAAQVVALPLARAQLTRWILGSSLAPVFGSPIGLALGLRVTLDAPIWGLAESSFPFRDVFGVLVGAIPGALAGISAGFLLGVVQAPAIPAYVGLRARWVLMSSIGWCAGGALFGGLVIVSGISLPLSQANLFDWLRWIIAVALFGFLAGGLIGAISRSQYSRLVQIRPSNGP